MVSNSAQIESRSDVRGESSKAIAVVLEGPERLAVERVDLDPAGPGDVVVDVEWSAISTGTERLLYLGRMPPFPGMGYPLVPGYEAVGRVRQSASDAQEAPRVGTRVFVGGARCFGKVRGLFGAAASRLVVPASRAIVVAEDLGERAVLLALAATAYHALHQPGARLPDLIVGHGVLGRLLARLALAAGGPIPVVWERDAVRREGAEGYVAIDPKKDDRHDYASIYDVSGDASLLDDLIARLAPGGEVVLAGFYSERLNFAFAPAFMREARFRVAAEWKPGDLAAVQELAASGRLSLDGLITHRAAAGAAQDAYRTAFADARCLKMVLDWRATA
ncbi:MAG TPA: chlorophyll synthesis pathway protein BchC [Burkholderiaceae bacterium]|nr:chlorophyll synthesis pathway protein BchC [Burkholderiaceae bacterium]